MPIREEPVYINRSDSVHSELRRIVRVIQRAGRGASRMPMRNPRERDGLIAIGQSPQKQRIDMTTYLTMQLTVDQFDGDLAGPYITLLFREFVCGCMLNVAIPRALENADRFVCLPEEDNKFAMGPCNGFNWEESGCHCLNYSDCQVLIINEPDEPSSSN